MRNFYDYYPNVKAEKIGTRNTAFYAFCRRTLENGEKVVAYVEERGTPYRLTATGNTVTVYIAKSKYNTYTITEESTGLALNSFDTLKQAVDSLMMNGNEYHEKYGNTHNHIATKWSILLTGMLLGLKSNYREKYVVITATGEIKEISDYPAEIQEKFFTNALNNGYGSARKKTA